MNEFWNIRYNDSQYFHDEICNELKEYINAIPKNRYILDYGCGTGRVCKLLRDLGHKVTGYDVSSSAIVRAKQIIDDVDLTTDIVCSKFDHIICHRVLHAVEESNRKDVIKYFEESLNKEGSIFLSARSKFCAELEEIKNNSNFISTQEENTFINTATKKYIHFFDGQEILNLFCNFEVTCYGKFIELSGKKKKNNTYFYLVAKKR